MAFEKMRNVEDLAREVGLYLVSKAQSAFRQQGRSGEWAPRAVPNRIGILEDLNQGRTPPSRRFEARPAGIDTGRLRSSIASRVSGNTVTVGTNLSYASDVQKGSTKTVRVDRQRLAEWLRSLPMDQRNAMRRSFGYLFHVGSLTVTVPPRPFLVLTDEDRKKINEMARKFFASGGKL